MTDSQLQKKEAIELSIKAFNENDLSKQALNLFSILSYNTERQSPFLEKTYQFFKDTFIGDDASFIEEKALVEDWIYVDILFQLSKNEVSDQLELFDTKKVDDTIIEAYLFFAIELKNAEYSRTALAQITREVNKLFPMPAMILFKHKESITLSVINRRLHKRDESKDVLQKVTLIKDISIKNPHRAHIEILFDLSFEELRRKYGFTNFVELHNAWQKTLDTKELNKRFYDDLSNWYFWAMKEVYYPGASALATLGVDPLKDPEVREHNAKNLIRLLTRLLFVWFVKEKKLIPEELFDERYIKEKLLNTFEPQNDYTNDVKTKGSCYYRAVLQNLFFATLNQVIGKREFRNDGQHMNVTNLMRYKNYFKDPKAFLELVDEVVPFMNGGLFECLDSPDPERKGKKGGDLIIYEDGFSDRTDNVLRVPDYVFFSIDKQVDLSEELGQNSKNKVKVKGLFNILKSYKFTVTENTPIEEDIALDPELLGRVFENLLASYNPETKTTARKQTGSFYTPREIVDYMVDESLKAYLKQKLEDEAKMNPEDAEAGLEFLIGYYEKEHLFDEKQTDVLINAIDNCKILDPACGSGAFPMGVLHKLVHILHKLDPNNKKWKERQSSKAQAIEDSVIRDKLMEDIETAFSNNELDYGRKLYLIENCIYGVDIQPIATQISKLRFFISLIVDQKTDKTKDNFGIRPLPNLETKFVAANILIGIEKIKDIQQLLLANPQLIELEKELKHVRHELFSAKTPQTKRKLRDKDKELRESIRELLVKDGWDNKTAEKIASWDPYDQNASSLFFDMEWMFGITDGFDIVIGNPPYIQLQKDKGKLGEIYKNCSFKTFERTGDIYMLFYEKGIDLLKDKGVLCFITSNKWMRAGYGKKLRRFFLEYNPVSLIDFGPGVFESATVDTNIIIIDKSSCNNSLKGVAIDDSYNRQNNLYEYIKNNQITLTGLSEKVWFVCSSEEKQLKEKIEKMGVPLKSWNVCINYGIKTGLNEAFIIDTPTKERLCQEDPKSQEILKPILRGRDIKRYTYNWAGLWLIHTGFDIDVPKKYPAVYKHLNKFKNKAVIRYDQGKNWWNLRACSYYDQFEKEKIVWAGVGGKRFEMGLASKGIFLREPANFMTGNFLTFFIGIIQSNLIGFYYNKIKTEVGSGSRFYVRDFIEIPIPPITSQNLHLIQKIENYVVEVITQKQQGKETCPIERAIDLLVYELYDLTPDEINIIESS